MFRIFRRGRPAPGAHRKKRRATTTESQRSAAIEQFVVEEIEVAGVPNRVATGPRPRRQSNWRPAVRRLLGQVGLWAMLLLAALFSRSLWPVDESRYAAMAWEMFSSQQWLVPALNAAVVPVAPLYSWLTVIGWSFAGPVEWWPRVLPAIAGLASLILVARLARRLWPEETLIRQHVATVMLGTVCFAILLGFALPMLLLVAFTLLAWWALLLMWRARDARAWWLLGAALGGGLLSHGPVAAVYILSPALCAPLWAKAPTRPRWGEWYVDVLKAVALGALMLGAWLVPAAIKAGAGYAAAFLTTVITPQLAGFIPPQTYMWWYLFLVPFVFLPWFVWPLPWLRLVRIRQEPTDAGIAFCIAATIPTLAALSLFTVKQPLYLLPLVPAGALMISYLLLKDELLTVDQERALAGMTIPVILVGCLLAILPKLPRVDFLPQQLWDLSPFVGVAIVLLGITLAFLPVHEIRLRVQNLAILSVTSVVIATLTLGTQLDPLYRTDATAAFLASIERDKRPIAIVGAYDGEYHYVGRLTEPIQVLAPADIEQWLAWHPRGVLIAASDRWQPASAGSLPLHKAPRMGSTIQVWDAAALGRAMPRAGPATALRQ